MQELQEQICKSIAKIAPFTSSDIVQKAAHDLIENGIQSLNKLYLVESTDLVKSGISLFGAREIIEEWKKLKDQTKTQLQQSGTSHSNITNAQQRMRFSYFQVNYSKFPSDTCLLLKEKKILNEKQANEVVASVVNEVRLCVPNATRDIFVGISQDMATDYCETFKEYVGNNNQIVPFRLKYKLQNCFDNKRRNKAKRTHTELEAPSRPEAYGCKRWQVVDLPPGENRESLTDKIKELQEIFDNVSIKEWDWNKILDLMSKTYGLQRAEINAQVPPRKSKKNKENAAPFLPKSTDEIEEKFPFLFVYKGLIQHFCTLTGVDIEENFKQYLNTGKIDQVISYLLKQKEKNEKIYRAMNRAIQRKLCADPQLIALIIMISQTLNENIGSIVQLVEPNIKYSELKEHVENIPGAPCIYAKGKSVFHATRFYLTVDGSPRAMVKSFKEAIIWSLAMYFTLNLKYPQEAANTFDFIQRCIVDMNPDKGSKVPKGIRRRGPVTFTLALLTAGIERYCQKCTEEDDKSEEADNPDMQI